MKRLRRGWKRIIGLLLLVMMIAVLALGAIPASAEDRCLVVDDHGNCLLWLSELPQPVGVNTTSQPASG